MNFQSKHVLLEVTEISNSQYGKGATGNQTPDLATFELIWIVKGIGTVLVDMERYEIEDDTLWFLRSGHLKDIDCDARLTGYRITFSRAFLASPTGKLTIPALLNYSGNIKSWYAVKLNEEGRSELGCIVSLMMYECQSNQSLKFDVLQGCLKIVVAYFSRLADVSDSGTAFGNDQVLFNTFFAMVEEQFHLRKLVSEYASELAVSANYLSEVVRRASGYSAGYHIRQRLLSEAKRMALNTALPVKQIAYELGFEDASTFSKFFKKEVGINLTEFRNSRSLG